ncbi:MAG: hypothetical protein SOW68_05205 [Eubacteriales bacterium]|nr:hypothetical protein [Eubacteriales bacterium]
MDYWLLTGAAVLLGADFALNKLYQRGFGTSPKAVFFFNSLLGLITAVLFFALNGFRLRFTVYSFVLAGAMSVLVMCYNALGFRLLKSGTVALYTLFLMTGGAVLPYLWGLLFWDEPFRMLRTVGLLIILAGVILSNFSGERISKKQSLLCAAVFVLNGFVSIISKLHQSQTVFACVNASEFIVLGGLFKFLLAGILFLCCRDRDAQARAVASPGKAACIIAASAIVGGSSYLLQLLGARTLPATVLYPMITGGSIVFSALAGVIVFREKLSAKLIVSVLLCVAGTLLFL